MIFLIFIEVLFYLRTYKSFGKLVQLVWLVLKGLQPFFMLFLLGLIMFSSMFYLLNLKFNQEEDYSDIHPFFLKLIQTYHMSLGSENLPDYSYWTDGALEGTELRIVVYAVWFVWFAN